MNAISPSTAPCCQWSIEARNGLIAVLIIAAATRLIGLGHLDPWGDEVYSHIGSGDLVTNLLRWDVANNDAPPWSYFEIKLARAIFGESSAWSLRAPSAFHGILAVGLLYVLLLQTVGWRIAFASALMLAINPWCLEWSREGRMYQQWLSFTLLLMLALHHAVEYARTPASSPLHWRWWSLGMVFMLVFTTHYSATMTLAGAGAWLALMAVTELSKNRAAGRTIILGSALSGLVFLGSWGLTGLAKILSKLHSHKPATDWVPPRFIDELLNFTSAVNGNVPIWAGVALWLLALAGIAMIAARGHWRFAALIAIVSLSAWMGFPTIVKTHFFTARYVFTALIVLSAGLGVILAALWDGMLIRKVAASRAVAILLLAGMAALWAPYAYEVFFVPKMAVRSALAPIQQHAVKGEVLILYPDWYVSFNKYKPYRFGDKVRLIRGPKGTWYDLSPDDFDGTFEELFTQPDPTANPPAAPKQPPATWVFMLRSKDSSDAQANWDERLRQLEPVLAAYGLKRDDLSKLLEPSTYTITLRLSRDEAGAGRINHVVKTVGRKYR